MPEIASAIQTVAIIEPGLIGASFGLALREAGFTGRRLGVGKAPYIEIARERCAIDHICSLEEAAASADLILLSGTVSNILDTIEQLAPLVGTNRLITDVGSTKRIIVEKANGFLPPDSFVGGHPMAGKEKRGAENAEAGLFRDRPYILTSRPNTLLFSAFVQWLQRMGVRIVEMDATQHDETVAFSSHLPQLLSTALAYTLSLRSDLPINSVFGSGLTDMTRLAMSAPGLWDSILETNRDQVLNAVDSYIATLKHLQHNLTTSELVNAFEVAQKYSYLLRKKE